jgi:hypothetical protein
MKTSILLCLLFAGIVLCQEEDPTKDVKAVRGVFEVSLVPDPGLLICCERNRQAAQEHSAG